MQLGRDETASFSIEISETSRAWLDEIYNHSYSVINRRLVNDGHDFKERRSR